jgi:hypothetical protein
MKVKALRRPNDAGRTTSQLTHARRARRPLRSARPVTGADRLAGRWPVATDGRLVLTWSLERTSR